MTRLFLFDCQSPTVQSLQGYLKSVDCELLTFFNTRMQNTSLVLLW